MEPKSGLQKRLDVLTKLAAIAGFAFAAFEWTDAKRQKRVNQSLSYVENLTNPSSVVGSANKEVSSMLWRNANQIRRLAHLAERLDMEESGELLRTFRKKYSIELKDSFEKQQNLLIVLEFYDALLTCIDENICEESVSMSFLSGRAENLWSHFKFFIESERDISPNLGHGLEEFVQREYPAEN